MMRPMRLGGDEILFGRGTLSHLAAVKAKKAVVVIGGDTLEKTGTLGKALAHLDKAGIEHATFKGVEPEPGLATVRKGASFMEEHEPDLIVALGGGSVMDAAKAMWIFYEHPETEGLEVLQDKERFPRLRQKARMVCIPTTAGTGSEVSRSIVIKDDETGVKHGIGNMEMMPDVAICDPETTLSLPPRLTAETGMDAITHALEALVSRRANTVSDLMAEKAFLDGFQSLPSVFSDPENVELREKMLNASLLAGMAFTNVSLGVVHAVAHALGSIFDLPHGLTNAVLLPYAVNFNKQDGRAAAVYRRLEKKLGKDDLAKALIDLNIAVDIPLSLSRLVPDEKRFSEALERLVELSLADGCMKTNPVIPDASSLAAFIMRAYEGPERL